MQILHKKSVPRSERYEYSPLNIAKYDNLLESKQLGNEIRTNCTESTWKRCSVT